MNSGRQSLIPESRMKFKVPVNDSRLGKCMSLFRCPSLPPKCHEYTAEHTIGSLLSFRVSTFEKVEKLKAEHSLQGDLKPGGIVTVIGRDMDVICFPTVRQ